MKERHKKRLEKLEESIAPERVEVFGEIEPGKFQDKNGKIFSQTELDEYQEKNNVQLLIYTAVWGHEAEDGDQFIAEWQDGSAENDSQS